jgi:threonine dehydratase
VLTSRTANEEFGASLFFKARTCSAWAPSSSAAPTMPSRACRRRQRRAGVVTFSSGNHAQAIALSARLLGVPATIIMPQDAPAAEGRATKGYGGEVVLYDRYTEDREQIGRELAAKRG